MSDGPPLDGGPSMTVQEWLGAQDADFFFLFSCLFFSFLFSKKLILLVISLLQKFVSCVANRKCQSARIKDSRMTRMFFVLHTA